MTLTTADFERTAASVRAFDGRDVGSLPRAELLALQGAVGEARKSLDALAVQVAAEVGRRSGADAGVGGLARREGFASPQQLVAQALGTTPGEAARMVELGAALRAQDDAGAGAEPGAGVAQGPRWPVVAQAMTEGRLGVQAAAMVTRTLEKWAECEHVATGVEEMERRLVAKALELPPHHLRAACQRLLAHAFPREVEERERRQHEQRSVVMTEDHEGMMVLHARLDAASGVWVRTWLDAQVKHAFQRRREEHGDARTAQQIRADALVMLARHGLDCEQPTSGVKTTLVVRIGLDELKTGVGIAECDATSVPLSASTVRAMAVDAQVIPAVMGGKGLPLDIGRTSRLFNQGQRLALVERDGGCAWCHAPPSYCEAHHIEWWGRDTGRTDLDNGVMLCVSCHHRIHADNWGIRVRDGDVWFTPPRSIDPEQRPRVGGRAHLDLAA